MRSFFRTNRVLGVLAIVGVLGLGLGTSLVVAAPNGSPGVGQIGICHHTGNSQAHEFIFITPDASGVFDGHGQVSHQNGDDIIPAFSFVNPAGETINFPGQNLSTVYDGFTGAELLANGCEPGSHTTTTTTTTITHTTTTTTTTTSTGHTTTTVPTTTDHTTTTTTTVPTTTDHTTTTTTTVPTTTDHTTTDHTTTTTTTVPTTTDHTTTDHTTTTVPTTTDHTTTDHTVT
jgi:hypothetical protein